MATKERRERGPEHKAPEYRAPEYRAPEYRAPEYRAPEYRAPEYRAVDKVACHMGAADGYGGQAPGSEYCDPREVDTGGAPALHDARDIVDFHLGSHGDFWVCSTTECHEGSFEEALYVLGGKREVEG